MQWWHLVFLHTWNITQLCCLWCPDDTINLRGVGSGVGHLICDVKLLVRPFFSQQSNAPDNKQKLLNIQTQKWYNCTSCGALMVLWIWWDLVVMLWVWSVVWNGWRGSFLFNSTVNCSINHWKIAQWSYLKSDTTLQIWCFDGALNLREDDSDVVGLICNMKWEVKCTKWWEESAQNKWCSACILDIPENFLSFPWTNQFFDVNYCTMGILRSSNVIGNVLDTLIHCTSLVRLKWWKLEVSLFFLFTSE